MSLSRTLAVPSVSTTVFSSFECSIFGTDDVAYNRGPDGSLRVLTADLAISCDGPDYAHLRHVALGLMALWPLGVPALFAGLLLRSRVAIAHERPDDASRSIAFLHSEYVPSLFAWELVELPRKLILTGFVQLAPSDSLARPVISLLTSLAYLVLLQAAAPYRQPSTYFFALAAQTTLTCTLLGAVLIKMYLQLTLQSSTAVAEGIFPPFLRPLQLWSLLALFNITVAALLAVLLAVQQARSRRGRAQMRLRWLKTGELVHVPHLPVDAGGRGDRQQWQPPPPTQQGDRQMHHLFLSHEWVSGQEKMRVIKHRLLEMLPQLRLFLDVDDLTQLSDLEAAVDGSSCVLVCCSLAYCRSRNCMRELRQAIRARKRLIPLMEADPQRGAVTEPEMREALEAAAAAHFERWGFDSEWPRSHELANALFERGPIEWTRLGPYQAATMRLIAEAVLGCPAGATSVHGEMRLDASRQRLLPPAPPLSYHLFVSTHNEGAAELVAELAAASVAPRGFAVTTTADDAEMASCAHFLVYLTGRTWADADATAAFEAQLEAAMELGVSLLLVHEQPGHGQERRHAVEFSRFFEVTPAELMAAGLYDQIAVPMRAGALRSVGKALLAHAIGAVHHIALVSVLKDAVRMEPSWSRLPPPSASRIDDGVELATRGVNDPLSRRSGRRSRSHRA